MLVMGVLLWQLNTLCLAETLYFEARGEDLEGQLMVAEVILNRVEAEGYAGSICGVTHQPNQFPGAGNYPPKKEQEAWASTLALAYSIQLGREPMLGTDAIAFHSGPRPKGFGNFTLLGQVGSHTFYTE